MKKTAIIFTAVLAIGRISALKVPTDFNPLQEDFYTYKENGLF